MKTLVEKFLLFCKLSCVLVHNVFIIWTNEVLQDEIYLMEKIPTLFYIDT